MNKRPTTREASALIMIMALIILIAVLAFGMLGFVSDQRGWARNKQVESLIRQAQLSGRSHFQKVLEQSYLAARAAATPTLTSQTWVTDFAASGVAWPNTTTHPVEATRQTARQTLANGAWGQTNAINLWRFESGMSSPIVRPTTATPHGSDDGYCIADGTGRWFTLGYLDRDLNPVDPAKASLQLRYAVSAIDLSGLLLANKARYEHLTSGAKIPATYRSGANIQTASIGAPAVGTNYAITESWAPDVMPAGSGSPCPQTDMALGRTDNVNGYDALRLNTWRPIPVDHSFSAHMLLTVGCALDDSTPRTLSDSAAFLAGGTVGNKSYMWMTRTPGNLPDAWRNQGYRSVTLNYWQFSRRFSDFLPFDQNPHPVTSGNPWLTSNGVGSTDQTIMTPPKRDRQLATLPPLGNRHPAALLVTLQNSRVGQPLAAVDATFAGVQPAGTPYFSFAGDPYNSPMDQNPRLLGDIWNQIDLPNWLAVQQGLRLHKISAGSSIASGLPALPNKADGMTECWSPFGSSIERFTGAAGTATITMPVLPSIFSC